MDFATLIGLIIGAIVIALAVLSGSDASIFFNMSGLLIVPGGIFAVTLIKFPINQCLSAFLLGMEKAYWDKIEHPLELVTLASELSGIVRKTGMLALENMPIKNSFFQERNPTLCGWKTSGIYSQSIN